MSNFVPTNYRRVSWAPVRGVGSLSEFWCWLCSSSSHPHTPLEFALDQRRSGYFSRFTVCQRDGKCEDSGCLGSLQDQVWQCASVMPAQARPNPAKPHPYLRIPGLPPRFPWYTLTQHVQCVSPQSTVNDAALTVLGPSIIHWTQFSSPPPMSPVLPYYPYPVEPGSQPSETDTPLKANCVPSLPTLFYPVVPLAHLPSSSSYPISHPPFPFFSCSTTTESSAILDNRSNAVVAFASSGHRSLTRHIAPTTTRARLDQYRVEDRNRNAATAPCRHL